MDRPTLVPRKESDEKQKTKLVNYRIPVKLLEDTKQRVEVLKEESPELNMTQYVVEMLKKTNEGRDYDNILMKNQVLSKENFDLRKENEELKVISKVKIPKYKRISISFTRDEYDMIDTASHQAKTSKSEFLKNRLFSHENQLTVNQPELM